MVWAAKTAVWCLDGRCLKVGDGTEVALVTGASLGIGKATGLKLANPGSKVAAKYGKPVDFLAAERAGYITAQVITIDGRSFPYIVAAVRD